MGDLAFTSVPLNVRQADASGLFLKGLTRKTTSLWLDCGSTNRKGGRTVKAILGLTLPNCNKYVLPLINIPKGVRKGIVVYALR